MRNLSSLFSQESIIALASKYDFISILLARFWRKRMLARIATARLKCGEIFMPLLLLRSLKNKKIVDIKKANLLSYKCKVMSGSCDSDYTLPKLRSNHNKSVLLVVHNSLPYDTAGYALRTLHEAKAYVALGYSVAVITRQGYPWDLLKHKSLPYTSSKIIEGIEFITLKGSRKYKIDSDIKYAIEYGNQVAKIAISRQAGVIQASSNYINGLAGYIASRNTGIPLIYEARGMWHITRSGNDPIFKASDQFRFEEKAEQWVIQNASVNFFITDIVRKRYSKEFGNRSAILRNCIDVNNVVFQKTPENNNDSLRIIYAGSLVYYEGLEYLIKAVSLLAADNVSFSIYGDGPYASEVKGQIKSLGLDNVTYFGRVGHDELKEIFTRHDLAVVPRIDCEVTRMVPPLKPLESICNGIPVIVSDLPAIRELTLGLKSVLFVPPGSVSALVFAIRAFRRSRVNIQEKVKSDADYLLSERSWFDELRQALEIVVVE